jgi:hypothetical protein
MFYYKTTIPDRAAKGWCCRQAATKAQFSEYLEAAIVRVGFLKNLGCYKENIVLFSPLVIKSLGGYNYNSRIVLWRQEGWGRES